MSVGVGRLAAAGLIVEPQFGGAGRRRENEMTEPGSRGGHSPSYGGDTSREWGAGARRSAQRGASDMQKHRRRKIKKHVRQKMLARSGWLWLPSFVVVALGAAVVKRAKG